MTDYDEEYDDVEVETEEEEWADEPDPEGMAAAPHYVDMNGLLEEEDDAVAQTSD